MISIQASTFAQVHRELQEAMNAAPPVRTERWQGIAANTDTYELQNVCFEVPLNGVEDLDHYRSDISPSLPWADDHFLERVCGEPINPGVQWANWPYGLSASKFRSSSSSVQRFNHNYMERLWPKFARRTDDGKLPTSWKNQTRKYPDKDPRPKYGIAHFYGDLQDVVDLISKEPYTRQAYIPLFFPEDTGKGDGGRKPCTIGYQFTVREDKLHIWYPLRSCDFIRHWRDDCYMAVRLLLWVLDECRKLNPEFWNKVTPGTYAMHMTSLHIFVSDRISKGA
jgi:hypothetical protein